MTEKILEKIENAEYEGLKDCIELLLSAKRCTEEEIEEMSEDEIFEEGTNLRHDMAVDYAYSSYCLHHDY